MQLEINEKLLNELRHTAKKLRQSQERIKKTMRAEHADIIDNDIRSGYTLLEAIVDSVEHGVSARPCLIKRENEETGDMHTHVLMTSFCISNEWLGDDEV